MSYFFFFFCELGLYPNDRVQLSIHILKKLTFLRQIKIKHCIKNYLNFEAVHYTILLKCNEACYC